MSEQNEPRADEPSGALSISAITGLGAVDKAEWDGLANPGWRVLAGGRAERIDPAAPAFNPFLPHDFLMCLEEAGGVGQRTGWQPRHDLETALERAIHATRSHRKASTTT